MNVLDFLTNGQSSQLGLNGDGAERLVANLMLQRAELMKSLLDTPRDVDSDCQYPTGWIPPELYQLLYMREPIATRVVEVFPKECFQVSPSVYEDEDAGTVTPFEEAWDALGKQLRGEQSFYQEEESSVIWDFLLDADIKSGIGHYAAILLGLDDGAPLDQPVDMIDATKSVKGSAGGSSTASRRLLFMQVYPETAVRINALETDTQNPRYGQPTEYDISMLDPLEFSSLGLGVSLPTNRAVVHWSRVVHISESGVLHTPRQRPVLNRLLDTRKLYSSSAEMYWRGAFPGYAIKTQPQLGADVDLNRKELETEITNYSNSLQRFLILMGMDVTALAPQISDPSSQIDKQIEAICIQLGIPKRIFMGSERGELASSQDDAAWNDRLKQRQLGVITPRIIIPVVDRLISLRVLPRPTKGYRVSWPDLTSKSDEEKAGIATQRTQAIAAYTAGQLETTLAPMDFWTRIMGFTEDESQSIIDNAEEVKQQKEKEQAAKDAEAAKVQAEAQAKMDAAAKTAADTTGTEQIATAPGSPTSPGKPFGGKGSQSPTSAPPNASAGQPGGSTVGGVGSPPVAHAFDPSQPRDASGKWTITGGGFARKVSLEGVHDSDVVGRIHSTLTDLSEQYGLKLDSVTTNQMAKDLFDNASAARMSTFTFSGGGQPTILSHNLELDSNVWQSKETLKAYRSSLPNGYLADSSVAGMIRHEYAHGLEKEHPEASALIRDVYASYRGNPTVSTYSAHDHREMLAEAFSHYHRQGSLEGTGLERLGPLFDSWKAPGQGGGSSPTQPPQSGASVKPDGSDVGGVGSMPVAHSDPTLVTDFDPSQARDTHGRWSPSGKANAFDYVLKRGTGSNQTMRDFYKSVHEDISTTRPAGDSRFHDPIRLHIEKQLHELAGDHGEALYRTGKAGMTQIAFKNHEVNVVTEAPGRITVFSKHLHGPDPRDPRTFTITYETPHEEVAYRLHKASGLKVDKSLEAKYKAADKVTRDQFRAQRKAAQEAQEKIKEARRAEKEARRSEKRDSGASAQNVDISAEEVSRLVNSGGLDINAVGDILDANTTSNLLDDDLLDRILENLDLASNAVTGPNPWVPYVGKRGGKGWKNGITGRIAYQLNQPGLGRGASATPAGTGTGAPTAPGQPRAQRADPTDVKNHIAKLLSDPTKITAADIHKVREDLLSMTVAQIHGVRKDLGLKASGIKKDLADKVATRALAGLGKVQSQPQTAPTPPQHQLPAPTQHPTPAATPVATPSQSAAAASPSPLHRGANVIMGTPAQAPMALPAVPHKEEIEWSTGKPEPGTLHGVDFAPAPHHFWEHVKDKNIGEPAPTRPINRAGVMVQEPDGRIWIVRPTNEFGDRKHTLPGGGVETGLTHQQNAMKEVWEETGLQVEITGHLGDFRDSNNGNNGRLYIGRRIGGAPWDAKIEPHIIDRKTGKPSAESSEVLLVTPERAGKLLHRTDDLAQLMTVAPIPLDTATRGRGSEPLKKFVEAIQPATKDFLSKQQAAGSSKPGNGELHAVQEIRGFNGKPNVVSKKDMDTLLAGGDHIEMLRGLSPHGTSKASDLANQFREGDHYPGFGVFGSGTYADSTKGYANAATSYAGYSSDSAMLRIALPKTAKIIKQSELEKKVPINPDEFKGYQNSQGSYSNREEWHGVHAAMAGYDAIYVDGNSSYHHSYGKGYYVILNRSVLTVQKEDAKGHQI